MGGLGYRHFGRLQRRLQICDGFRKLFFCYFCAMRLRVCVCYMFKFGAGGLIVLITQTYGLLSFLGSDVYSGWRKRNANREIPLKTAQSCIYFCIKEAKLNKCACMMCVQFRYLLKAWDKQRKDWHITPCRCTGCRFDKYAAFMEASSSSSAFKKIILCPKYRIPILLFPIFQTK